MPASVHGIISFRVLFHTFLILLTSQATYGRQGPYYDTSFAFLAVLNDETGEEVEFCVSYEQWRTGSIAPDKESAEPLLLGWWGGIENNTNVCRIGSKESTWDLDGRAAALNYRLKESDGPCALPFVVTNTSFRKAIQYEADQLMKYNASVGILLVEKGYHFVSRWADYLFSDFYDPDLKPTTKIPIFFMYSHVFFQTFLDISGSRYLGDDLSLRFYRPPSSVWDISMLLIWFIAVFCVSVGGYWAGHRKICEERKGEEKLPENGTQEGTSETPSKSKSSEEERMSTWATFVFLIIIMGIVVGILMLGFYFRDVMVNIFNVILAIFGTFSVHRCLTALTGAFCKCGKCEICVSMNDVTRSVFSRDLFNYNCCSRRPRVISILIFFLSAALCTVWYICRRGPYAFLLLDFINITLCLHVLKGIRIPNLKWLTTLLICMFIYDVFMVFVTPYLTKNGCSVMIEVAAGTDCSKSGTGYPVAPINADLPEKFPMLFQVPRLSDPMFVCYDLAVEKEFHPVILGLGDVIIPGYLISFCFTVDFAIVTRHMYGIVSIAGYGVGLFVTFAALTLMETAQPALIYLIPFTLLPVVVLALIRRELKILWTGEFVNHNIDGVTASESTTVQIDAELGSTLSLNWNEHR